MDQEGDTYMDIQKKREDDRIVLTLNGRLDGYWAEHLDREIEELLRTGARRIQLDLTELSYMSSAGIRILVKFKKSMQTIGGTFTLCHASDFVRGVLVQTGLATLFLDASPETVAKAVPEGEKVKILEMDRFVSKVQTLNENAILSGRLVGNPNRLAGAAYELAEAVSQPLSVSMTGLGIGALGKDLEDCRERFGELLVAGGAAVYQPTDGARTPDFMLCRGDFAPTLHTLHALLWKGTYRHFLRYDSQSGEDVIGMSSLARQIFELERKQPAVFVMLAESAGLLGAVLKHSPLGGTAGTIFDHPDVVDWISFAAERVHRRALTLSVGIVAGEAGREIPSFLRPLGGGSELFGHIHTVALSYRTLPEGLLQLSATVTGLFETQDVLGILHMLHDDRDISGAGESEFYRGALWMGPIEIEGKEAK